MQYDKMELDADTQGQMLVIIHEAKKTVASLVYENQYTEVMGVEATVSDIIDYMYDLGKLEGLVLGNRICREDYDLIWSLEREVVRIQVERSELYGTEPAEQSEQHIYFAYDVSEEYEDDMGGTVLMVPDKGIYVKHIDYLESLGWEPEVPHKFNPDHDYDEPSLGNFEDD